MATFPSSICQNVQTSYVPSNSNKRFAFDYGTRNRVKESTYPEMNVQIVVEKEDAIIFETWFYETINGGVDSFTAPNFKLGSLVTTNWRISGNVTSTMHRKDSYMYSFTMKSIDYGYGSLQDCPLLPNDILFIGEDLEPC